MKSENTKAMERDAAAKIMKLMRLGIDSQAEELRLGLGKPVPWSEADVEKGIELQYATVAMLQAAIDDGLDPALAIQLLRTTAMVVWATKHLVQHGGKGCLNCATSELQMIASQHLAALGLSDVTVSAILPQQGEPASGSTRH